MNYWLVKSEPVKYAWDQLVKDGKTFWNGVRNYQAANNLKAKKGDQAFFYHSNEGLEIVGICEIAKEYYPDHTDESGKFGMVDVKPSRPLKNPVTLAAIKAEPALADISLIKQSRLSVMPITPAQWKLICKMGGIKP
ncbi:MAG: EVE domain-containing protein [Rhodospirillaceae bacterium]|nr:EVE domain-containing protein [Rhodospirillaceae bacterium]